ncbi:MFS transporter [Alicyclobacillus herbarius]|uniref:MFS transporter n=1 Tax=Alicyclobacillus herbarius TaxID=122960 RepID=UPI00040F9346|nr:MFS transporter [Alicyclobacillus herbarius]
MAASTSKALVIGALAAVPFVMVLGNSVLIPVLPEMARQMHVSKMAISLLITLFSVPAGVVIPLAGAFSDALSRKWVVIPSLFLFGAGGVLAGVCAAVLPHPYVWVLIGRILQGIGAAGTAPIAMAWMADQFQGAERSKALGASEAGNAFGKVTSPILGSAVGLIAWFAVFFVFPLLCLPLAWVVWRTVSDSKRPENRQNLRDYLRSLGQLFRREGHWLWVAYLSGAAALFNLFGVLFYLSDLLETVYKVAGIRQGLYLAIPLVAQTLAALAAGWLMNSRKQLMKWLLVMGFVLLAAALGCASWLVDRPWWLLALLTAGAIGTGSILPSLNTLITSVVGQEQRGIVTSFYNCVRFLGVAFGPPVYTWLLSYSARTMFLVVSGLAVALAILDGFFIRVGHRSPPQSGALGEKRGMDRKRSARVHRMSKV